MRRARHKLQVSTFPFLAVLLCAMGALILFLLVMDRRGKIVARAKARDALAARADHDKEDAERKAAWQKQKDALHQALLAEQQELGGEAARLQEQLADARHKMEAKQSEYAALEHAAASEKTRLAQHETHVAERKADLLASDKEQAA